MAAALVKALDIPEDKMFALFRIGRARIDSSRSVPHLIEEPGNRRVAARFVLAKKNRCQFFEFVHFLDLTARLQSLATSISGRRGSGVFSRNFEVGTCERQSQNRRAGTPNDGGLPTACLFLLTARSCGGALNDCVLPSLIPSLA